MSAPVGLVAVRPFSPILVAALLEPPAFVRLEPQSVSGDPTPGLEARVHDPLWLLARQWQLGELEGEDAGSPLLVHVRSETAAVTAWQPGDVKRKRPARALPAGQPLDPLVEQEGEPALALGIRQRAEAGAHLVERLADAGLDARAALRAACPLAAVEPAPVDGVPEEHLRLPVALAVLARALPDGAEAAAQLEAAGAGGPPWLAGASAAALAAAQEWLAWYRANVEPRVASDDDCWDPERLEYGFSLRVGGGASQRVLRAPAFDGGEIDWFSFDHAAEARLEVPGEGPAAAPEARDLTVFSTPLRFAGMPSDRYWQCEDGQVNLGRLEAQPHDLARLCLAEFALVYGNDWLAVPLDVSAGSFTTLREVAYTTTFGERVVVQPADAGRRGGFRLYGISSGDDATTLPGLFVPPAALDTHEGRPLEEVLFLRDEMANLVWAVERLVQGRSGDPRSRGDEPRPFVAPDGIEAGAELAYLLETEVPRHWIPFVPVAIGLGQIALRKGTLHETDSSLGLLLHATPLTIREEEIPRAGVRVRRVPSLARADDGRHLRWIARRVSVGRGEGGSGLAYDGALPR